MAQELDLGSAFQSGLQDESLEYRDPQDPEYGYDPERWTPNQKAMWDYYLRREEEYMHDLRRLSGGEIEEEEVRKVHLADLGGIGSGKTRAGAIFAARQVQKYPGSVGLFCSNTFGQVKGGPLKEFKQVMARLGFSWTRATYHKEKIIRGTPYESIIVIRLSENSESFVRLGSFKTADNLESEEFDWGVLNEVQSADKEDFTKAYRRIRTRYANAAIYVDGTPKKKRHWQYDILPDLGFEVWRSDTRDNPHKKPGYADELRMMYGANKAESYVDGSPISTSEDAVFHNFEYERHVESRAARELTEYERPKPLYVVFDFNLTPMSISFWQIKDGSSYEGFAEKVLAQIDELEVWNAGTREACRKIIEEYGDHGLAGGKVTGDGTETKSTKSPDETDWDIIREGLGDMDNMRIQPGTDPGAMDEKGGRTWNNPPIRTTINAANRMLKDGHGRSHVVFLPEPKYPSGGVQDAVAELETADDGTIDKTVDRTTSRDATQSHFADTFRYICYDRCRTEGIFGDKPLDNLDENPAESVKTPESTFSTGKTFSTGTSFSF